MFTVSRASKEVACQVWALDHSKRANRLDRSCPSLERGSYGQRSGDRRWELEGRLLGSRWVIYGCGGGGTGGRGGGCCEEHLAGFYRFIAGVYGIGDLNAL